MTRFSKLLPALILLGACSTVKKLTPDLSRIPAPPLPSFSGLKKIATILPGMPESDTASVEDPKVPFNSRQTLGYGHTLRLHVYEGSRSTKRIYNGVVMVDEKGVVAFPGVGSARVGGLELPKAAEAVATAFRVGLRISRAVTVHILSVEDLPLVAITGDVIKDEYIPAWEKMTVKQAVTVAGGRRLGSANRGVYLIREGHSRYFPSLEAADRAEPEPGDIIHLSTDL
ncbi:MAG TPA: hypothetical protein DIT13_11130 [Verrucomicrobiales bacterium]|nr:hypothetical protein [Verrucomicrobiales bacterium]HRJ08984.1 hypothetical protein [Prosthecobacter sp.]HRK17011.1 hypothetical protein [Prosthecobacter sp.]